MTKLPEGTRLFHEFVGILEPRTLRSIDIDCGGKNGTTKTSQEFLAGFVYVCLIEGLSSMVVGTAGG